MLTELNEVIPVFLQRVDQQERGGAWTRYLAETRAAVESLGADLYQDEKPDDRPMITLVDWDPDGEEKIIAAMLYAVTDLPDDQLRANVRRMSEDERLRIARTYVGERRNRRHKPGRALEASGYRFDVLADYGAFRDLQRHRLLTMEWQDLTPRHGYDLPPDLDELGVGGLFREAMDVSAELWSEIAPDLPKEAQYAVCMAYRIRFVMQLNAREALHMLELRSSPQGHPSYRAIAHEMHRQIADVAGHRVIASMMNFVDHSNVDLERLEAERRAERKRSGKGSGSL
jgi:thymidylate synthase-like protein